MPPGLTAGVAAMNAPALNESALPDRVIRFVDVSARVRDTDQALARSGVRLLRRDLGTTGSDVYAFRTHRGAICFLVTGQAGACPRDPTDGTPGLSWTIGGGYGEIPSSLAGIVSDDVDRVALVIDGQVASTSIKNNVVYGEFARDAHDALIAIHRRDGTETKVKVRLDG